MDEKDTCDSRRIDRSCLDHRGADDIQSPFGDVSTQPIYGD